MKSIKKLTAVLTVFVLLLSLSPGVPAAAESSEPSRLIHVVYDDSYSMIKTGGSYVDTWCKTKYSMEVFAALLGANDTMNIYYMSDFDQGANGSPKLTLKGGDTAANVKSVHDLLSPDDTARMNTPFKAVEAAYRDLLNADGAGREKWLVVLTDGAFETNVRNQKKNPAEVDAFFAGTDPSVNVMFLAIGSGAAQIHAGDKPQFFFRTAQTSDQILNNITDMGRQMFNSHKLELGSDGKISFDLPMSELVVFAQGQDVKIEGITDAEGKPIPGGQAEAQVRFSDKPYVNAQDPSIIVDTALAGKVKVFQGEYPEGDYQVKVSGAETVEVYYKPDVAVNMFLTDANGNSVTEMEKLEAGTYTLDFGFVKPGTVERLPESKLLGAVKYEARISNNGVVSETVYQPGDSIQLEEGDVTVEAIARYLDYNSVRTNMSYRVWKNKAVGYEVLDDTVFRVKPNGIESDGPYRVKLTLDGRDMTEAEWAEFGVPTVTRDKSVKKFYGDPVVTKTGEIGVIEITPGLKGDKAKGYLYGDMPYTINYQEIHGDEVWSGYGEGTMHISDGRTWLQQHWRMVVRLAILLAILALIIMYLPGVKAYLPKRVRKRPRIDCVPLSLYGQRYTAHGTCSKDLWKTFVPIMAETATLRYAPPGVSGATPLKLKATRKRNRMLVRNASNFVEKDFIHFDGESIEKEKAKGFTIGVGTTIEVFSEDTHYTCNMTER